MYDEKQAEKYSRLTGRPNATGRCGAKALESMNNGTD